jgi:hypothetical protein
MVAKLMGTTGAKEHGGVKGLFYADMQNIIQT